MVVSPHLDDGVFSLGATVARAVRVGAEVTMLTVMAGDVDSHKPAGWWDKATFSSAAEAFAARVAEDRRACAVLGARPVHLDFFDDQYRNDCPIDDDLAEAVAAEVSSAATVVVPGFPLQNRDHVLVARAVLDGLSDDTLVGFYTEQPYALRVKGGPAGHEPFGEPVTWSCVPAAPIDLHRKSRAIGEYRSQLRQLGRFIRARIVLEDLRRGGEIIGWRDSFDQ